jgi:RhtB (resistance to homoserine/threonine) family protein
MSAYWPEFLKLALAHLLAVVSPGPDFAIVLRQSLVHGHRTAVWTALGIGSAICLHVGYSLFGIGLLLKSSPAAFTAVKFAGAAYLAWLGVRSLRALPRPAPAPVAEAVRPAGGDGPAASAAWSTGFFTNALNPKATLFFVAIFATLVSPRTPLPIRLGYGAWVCLFTTAWFCAVAYLFTRERTRRAFLRHGHWIDRAMGALFLVYAAGLAFSALPGRSG